jgi:glycylpeptide N-tetradecanoyltransferase
MAPLYTEHKFWDTQPVPKIWGDVKIEDGEIETKTLADVRKDPLPLPDGFEWCVVDLKNDE